MPTRRTFLATAAAGVGATVIAPAAALAQSSRQDLPTARARALMSKFGMTYPVLQAPSGGQELAAAISNAGGIGAFALWRTSADVARQNVERMRTLTKKPFIVNYVLTFEPQSLGAALEAGAPIVQFSWGIPTAAMASEIQRAGARFGVQVATPDGARAAVDAGAAYLVAQGVEVLSLVAARENDAVSTGQTGEWFAQPAVRQKLSAALSAAITLMPAMTYGPSSCADGVNSRR